MRAVIAKRKRMVPTVASVSVVSLALIVSVIWFLGTPGQVHACKCAEPGSPSEELEKFAAVFAGRVVSIEHSYDPNAASVSPEDRTTVGFEVSAVWKGAVYESMYVTTPPTGGSCGFAFIEEEEYIVYGHDSNYDDGGYTVGICSRTALLGQAQADLDALGEGSAPQAGVGGPAPEQPQDGEGSAPQTEVGGPAPEQPQDGEGSAPQAEVGGPTPEQPQDGEGSAPQAEVGGPAPEQPQDGEGSAPQTEVGGPAPEQPQDTVAGRAWIIILAVAAAIVVVSGSVVYARVRRR